MLRPTFTVFEISLSHVTNPYILVYVYVTNLPTLYGLLYAYLKKRTLSICIV